MVNFATQNRFTAPAQPNRPYSRHRLLTSTIARRSLRGNSFPIPGKYIKEITYRRRGNAQDRYRYYVPHIPESPVYDDIWFAFSSAVHSWQDLSLTNKLPYNERANKMQGLSGYNLFIREYMNANYP